MDALHEVQAFPVKHIMKRTNGSNTHTDTNQEGTVTMHTNISMADLIRHHANTGPRGTLEEALDGLVVGLFPTDCANETHNKIKIKFKDKQLCQFSC
jgi:hypothetical protein